MGLQAPRNSGLQAFIAGPLQARLVGVGTRSFEDDFDRADGTLDTGDFTWWIPTDINIYNNTLTLDADGRGWAYTPTTLGLPVSAQVDIYRDDLSWVSGFMSWVISTGNAGGVLAWAQVTYDAGNNRWYFLLQGIGMDWTGFQAGLPAAGTITLDMTSILKAASYDGNNLSLAEVPGAGPYYVHVELHSTADNIQKRAGFDNFIATGTAG